MQFFKYLIPQSKSSAIATFLVTTAYGIAAEGTRRILKQITEVNTPIQNLDPAQYQALLDIFETGKYVVENARNAQPLSDTTIVALLGLSTLAVYFVTKNYFDPVEEVAEAQHQKME